MILEIENESDFLAEEGLFEILEDVCSKTLQHEGFLYKAEVYLLIVNDSKMKILNEKHRKIDKTTDVLSFPLYDFSIGDYANISEKEPIPIGDIVISIDRALAQANDYGHSLIRELAFLCVHSILHLLGYDHMNEPDEKQMFSRQEEILNLCNIKR